MIRIVGGEYRSRRLVAPPDDETTRPYIERVREAVFNLLRGWFDDARVLDLFAGIGSMGLEAASRGAAEVVLVERDRKIAALARENVAALGCGDRVTVVQADALGETALAAVPQPCDVVFCDPPYAMMRDETERARVLAFMPRLLPLLARPSFLVLRAPFGADRVELGIPGFAGPEEHRYGREMAVHLYQPAAEPGRDA